MIEPHVFRKYKAMLMSEFTAGASKVLEVGCGMKQYARFCLAEEYVCVDLAWQPDVVASATYLPFRDRCFDRVVMMDVLEHVGDVSRALNECGRVLAPNGELLILTPNYAGFGIYDSLADPTHRYHFTWSGLKKILTKHGYKVKKEIPLHLHIYLPLRIKFLRLLQQSISLVAVRSDET